MSDNSARDAMHRWLNDGIEEHREKQKKEQLQTEFTNFDCGTLSTMTNKDLAKWQAAYPPDSPQYIIATQEWDRRAHEKQKMSNRQAALIGFAGAIIGAVITALIAWLLPPQKADNHIQPQIQSIEKRTQQDKQKKPIDTKLPIRQKP